MLYLFDVLLFLNYFGIILSIDITFKIYAISIDCSLLS